MARFPRRFFNAHAVALLAALIGAAVGSWEANALGGTITAGILDFTADSDPLANGSTTGDISTATSFTIVDMLNIATTSANGYFDGLSGGEITFASVPFTFTSTGYNSSFSLSNAIFGTFQSTFIVERQNSDTGGIKTREFDIYGTYTQGTIQNSNFPSEGSPRGPTSPSPVDALFDVSFQQLDGVGKTISFTGSLSFPVAVPEPGTYAIAMSGLSLIGLRYAIGRRRTASR